LEHWLTFALSPRALVAQFGLGANLPEDAIYPANLADESGKPLDGSNKYMLHFEKSDMPPANAFWSVSLYDSTICLPSIVSTARNWPIPDPINRCLAING
jgi:hypothetical protein